jgi:hypothetical protein
VALLGTSTSLVADGEGVGVGLAVGVGVGVCPPHASRASEATQKTAVTVSARRIARIRSAF